MLDTFYLTAPEGSSWPLDLDTVDQGLQERFPGMRGWIERVAPTGEDTLEFDLELHGATRTGVYYDGGPLILRDGDEQDWAPTIAWFISLLPADTPVMTMRETNPEQIVPLPADASAARIREVLEGLAIE